MACGPEPDPYDYYISFFHNNIQKTNDYRPFYFNGFLYLNDTENPVDESDVNAKEWAVHLKHRIKPFDVIQAMYGLTDTVESRLFNKYLIFNKLPDSLYKNKFLKTLITSSKKEILRYYLFVQGVEHLTKMSDRWYPEPRDTVKLTQKANEALARAKQTSDRFLKLRYYYNAQRLFYFAGNYRSGADIYKAHIFPVKSNSHIKLWSLDLFAGEQMHLGKRALAAYLYLKVFELCPERRVQAFYDYRGLKIPEAEVIKLTKNKAEKATVYAIKGFHTPRIGLTALKQVYQTYPRSDMVSALLVREINKIEETYLTPHLNGRNYYDSVGYYDHTRFDSLKEQYIKYIPKLQKFCIQLAKERKYAEPEIGYLSAAYLSWIQGNTGTGFNYLSAIKNNKLRPKLNNEKQLINLLLLSQSIKRMDKTNESLLLPSLTWLDKVAKAERSIKNPYWHSGYGLKFYSASARDFYAKVLAPIYFKQKDTVMAALCILKSERTIPIIERYAFGPRLGFDMPHFWQNNLHSWHLKKVLEWNSSEQRTQYLKLLMNNINEPTTVVISGVRPVKGGGYEYTETRHSQLTVLQSIYDLLGTSFLREHNYKAAVTAFHHINEKNLENSTSLEVDYQPFKIQNQYPDPFIDNLHDYPRVHSLKKVPGYNKLLYAETMAKLEQQIKTDPRQASKYYYKMANGLYNISYYGNAWNYTAYHWANNDITGENSFYYDKDYLQIKTAESYFLKANQLSDNPEFKARCIFMAAKCKQKRIAYPKFPDYTRNDKTFNSLYLQYDKEGKKYRRNLRRNPYFSELRDHYSKTAFYKLAINECSYFRDFIKGKKSKPTHRHS